MGRALAARQELVLRIIVREYIARAMPVASETLARNCQLGISPATIRNYMAKLEEEGYLTRPHTSAGIVPLGKAYRHYVQSLTRDVQLTAGEQRAIQRVFHDADTNSEEWIRLAAVLLARLVQNTALVTMPKAPNARLKHLQLVSLNDYVALLVVVLRDMKVRQQLVHFTQPQTQDELTRLANKVNVAFSLLTRKEIERKEIELTPTEAHVVEAVLAIMTEENAREVDRPYFEGLRLMLNQPEFTPGERMLGVMELVENMDWLGSIIAREPKEGGVEVIIGDESKQDALRDLSVVFTRYGIPDDVGGTIGVLGPTRMDYPRSIATVRYLSRILSNLLQGLYAQSTDPTPVRKEE